MKKTIKYIIGIDEVGRGCLAGPVVVAAVALPQNSKFKSQKSKIQLKNQNLPILRDSKKLSPKQREVWFKYAQNHPDIFYKISSVSPGVIDRINISKAANLAASRTLERLLLKKNFGSINRTKVFLDGGLYLKSNIIYQSFDKLRIDPGRSRMGQISKTQFKNKKMTKNVRVNPCRYLRLSASTIIKGDEKIHAIMLASIVAKVTRDRKMKKMHLEYPHYDFMNNVGYGTKKHRRAIKKHGPSPIHRRSFSVK